MRVITGGMHKLCATNHVRDIILTIIATAQSLVQYIFRSNNILLA
jgi:hypothetical protein